MLNKKIINPYIRVAMDSILTGPHIISERTLFDYELIFVKDGICKISFDNTPYTVEKNQVVFIKPGISHSFEVVENTKFIQPHIHFDLIYNKNSEKTPVSFKPKEKMSQSEIMLIQEDILKNIDIPFIFTPYNVQKFQKLITEIIKLFTERSHNYEILCKSKMLELISLILEQFETQKSTESYYSQNVVFAAKEYIDNNFQFNITLDSLSKQLYINKFTLMRNFRSQYGINIIEYYRKKRIDYAKILLENTNHSIYTIGELLNFSDIYSFSRFFKSQTNLSPNQFRKLKSNNT